MIGRGAFRRHVEAFLRRHGMKSHELGQRARNDTGFVSRLRNGGALGDGAMDAVMAFMDRYDADPATADQPMSRPIALPPGDRLEARRAHDREHIRVSLAEMRAGAAPIKARPLPADPFGRVMQFAGPETPADAIRLVRERWPRTWSTIVATAHAERMTPGALMIALIEDGLSRREAGQ